MKRNLQLDTRPIVRKRTLAQEVADKVRMAIITGQIDLGESLSEELIANALSVSRTPVREAFTILQHQGLVEIKAQRGTSVFRPMPEDITQLVDLRLHLEKRAAVLALENDPKGTLRDLRKIVRQMSEARERNDALTYSKADGLFHQAFFDHCGNPYYLDAFAQISGRIEALRTHVTRQLSIFEMKSYDEHLQILDSFECGNQTALVETLTEHISAMSRNYVKALFSPTK